MPPIAITRDRALRAISLAADAEALRRTEANIGDHAAAFSADDLAAIRAAIAARKAVLGPVRSSGSRPVADMAMIAGTIASRVAGVPTPPRSSILDPAMRERVLAAMTAWRANPAQLMVEVGAGEPRHVWLVDLLSEDRAPHPFKMIAAKALGLSCKGFNTVTLEARLRAEGLGFAVIRTDAVAED